MGEMNIMKPLRLTMAAIVTFCCSTLLQAQTLDALFDIDALLACDCESWPLGLG
jgi:hypothetical protein